jgi:ABC-type multidrug transport system permease subunit
MNQLLGLFVARSKEYYRDRGSLIWSFVMPPLIIAAIAMAFSGQEAPLLKVGLYPNAETPSVFADASYIQTVHFSDLDKANTKVRHHQIDLLVFTDNSGHYLFNPESQKAAILQKLLVQDSSTSWQSQALSGRQVRYIDWVIPGVLGMNLMFSGLFGVGFVIVRYRKNGVLKRLQATPVSPIAFLSAQLLSRLLIMLMVSTTVYLACDFFLDFLMLGSYIDLLLVAVTGNLCIVSLGLVVASRLANEELANGLLNLFAFPMMLLSEVWFSLDGAPEWMATASQFFPLTHMVQAARKIMVEGAGLAEVSHHLFMMLIMGAIFLSVAAYLFKWRTD